MAKATQAGHRAAILFALAMLSACDRHPTGPLERLVTVHVEDTSGAPAAGASVRWYGGQMASPVTTSTDGQGWAVNHIHEGWAAVYVQWFPPGGGTPVAGSYFVVPGRERASSDTVLVRLQVAAPSRASGTIRLQGRTDHSGTGLTSTLIPLPVTSVTDAEGRWTCDGLPPGDMYFNAIHDGFMLAAVEFVIPGPGSVVNVPDTTLASMRPVGRPD